MSHQDLASEYTHIIDALDALYSAGMYRSLTDDEQAQIDVLKTRAKALQPAVALRRPCDQQTESLWKQQRRLLEQIGTLGQLPSVATLDEAQAEMFLVRIKLLGTKPT